uniref:PDZ domain-containing protein n=1 Tax=Bursaphelenchus xylophilus TaxID=6326 RepID=A0A1I7RL72_BURXY
MTTSPVSDPDSGSNGTINAGASTSSQQFCPAPPFFSNPFMAPFLPQQPNGVYQSSSPQMNGQMPSGQEKTEFRVNPLTGGYFLSPQQYQEMMQQYMHGLLVAASQGQQVDPNMGDMNTANPFFPSSHMTAFSQCTLSSSSTPSKAPSLTRTDLSTSSSPVQTKDRVHPQSPLSFVDEISMLHKELINDDQSLKNPMTSSSNLECAETSSSPPLPQTSESTEKLQDHGERTETLEPNPIQPESSLENRDLNPAQTLDANEPASGTSEVVESIAVSSEFKEEVSTISPDTTQDGQRQRADSEPIPGTSTQPEAQPDAKKSATVERTTEMIQKQMNEIEKEINRRMQNKNVRQIDEAELAQLLNDHGFGSFVDAKSSTDSGSTASALPYRPPDQEKDSSRPTLEQLRSSFSPPSDHFAAQSLDPNSHHNFNFGPTATGNGLGLHGPAAFATSPTLPQGINAPIGVYPLANPQMMGQFPGMFPPQMMKPAEAEAFYPYPSIPVQNVFPATNPAAPGLLNSNEITPEMAAELLKKIQLQNPQLLEKLMEQQKAEPEIPKPVGIPAPPPPGSTIERPNPGNQRPKTESGDWPMNGNGQENGKGEENNEPVWVMRDTFVKRMQREEQRNRESMEEQNGHKEEEKLTGLEEMNEEEETSKLLKRDSNELVEENIKQKKVNNKKEVLIEGVLFRARYLGSTQMSTDGRATKSSRMSQAQEAVARVKAPDGDVQPSTEIDLFISTEKIMVLNTDLQRISETDVRQDILMDHALRSVSYIADIGDLVVLMARRVAQSCNGSDDEDPETIRRTPRLICHVFESEEASFIVQSIGQAFQVAYIEFLRANGIDDPACLREIDYQEVLNSQELMGEELEMFARKETQKDVIVPKKVGEALGIVVVESGWGSMLPTVVVANLAPGGPASRSNQLNIGDQIIAINGISLVGLPLTAAQQNIKNAKSSTAVRLTIVSTPPVVEVRIKRPDTKYQLGFSVQNGVICSLLRGGIAERGGIRVGHRIIEINHQSVVAVPHERIVNMLATATGEIHMKTMPTAVFRLLTGQEVPNYI